MKIRLLCLSFLLAATLAGTAKGKKELVILHTNDTHSCIYPLNINLADTTLAGRGGYLRRINMIKQEREKAPGLLLFDSGDFSQGSPYYTLFKGDVEVNLMNMMGYDACTIGNHEFDYGLENMARLFRMCKFPVLCANYDFTGTPVEGLVKPYTIIKRNGIKIGIFGLSPKMDGLVDYKNCKGVKFIDPVQKAGEMADLLKKKMKCDVVICISHIGWDMGKLTDDQDVIGGTRNIDIVLGGHSHTYLEKPKFVKNADGKDIPVDQNGKHALYVGKIIIQYK